LRKISAIVISVVGLSMAARAQFPTSGNVFFGYSYSQGQTFRPVLNQNISMGNNMNGWAGSLEGKFLPWLGVVAELGWHYGGNNVFLCSGSACTGPHFRLNGTQETVLFGPRASVSIRKYTPFAEALFGVAHQTDSGGGISNSDLSWAYALGGGLDYKLIKGVALRLQADDVRSALFGGHQSNFRLSTGIVFRF
jgi:opacity protein-like surface antigen